MGIMGFFFNHWLFFIKRLQFHCLNFNFTSNSSLGSCAYSKLARCAMAWRRRRRSTGKMGIMGVFSIINWSLLKGFNITVWISISTSNSSPGSCAHSKLAHYAMAWRRRRKSMKWALWSFFQSSAVVLYWRLQFQSLNFNLTSNSPPGSCAYSKLARCVMA